MQYEGIFGWRSIILGVIMKTHVIQLEIHDDVYSTKDKMMWGKSGQILLVIPADNTHLHRKLDLVILQRQAKAIGSKLGIVTQDATIVSIARELAIPYFNDTVQAQSKIWRVSKKARAQNNRKPSKIPLDEIRAQVEKVDLPKLENNWLRILIFGMAVFSLIALLVFLLPHATIKISMKESIQIRDLTIFTQPELPAVSMSGAIPTRKLSLPVSETVSIPAGGQIAIPVEKANGSVEMINISVADVTIPEGTLILSSTHPGITFETTKTVHIEAGDPKKAIVPVAALEPGTAGNVGTGELDQIEGDLNARVLVYNPEPTSGGKDETATAPTQEDYLKLKALLSSKLKATAMAELKKELLSGEVFLDGTLTEEEIISEIRQPEVNTAAQNLVLTVQARYSIYAIHETDLHRTAQMSLDASLPEEWMKKENSLFIQEISSAEIISHNPIKIELKIQAAQLLLPKIDRESLVQSLLGKTRKEASRLISDNLALTSAPEIKITPVIWKWLPFLPVNVELSFQ